MKVIYVAGKYRAETQEGVDANIKKAQGLAMKIAEHILKPKTN